MNVTELRPGNYFEDENCLYQVIDILLNKTAMRKMVAKVKVRNIRTGAVIELARNSGYDVEPVSINKKNMAALPSLARPQSRPPKMESPKSSFLQSHIR